MKRAITTSLIAACLLFICAESSAGVSRTLSNIAATAITGKTSSIAVHEPRDVNIFGMKYLGDHEDFDALKAMLGDDLLIDSQIEPSHGLLIDLQSKTDGYHVSGKSVPDPAPKLAEQIQLALETSYGVKPLDQQPLRLPATPVGNLVPKTNVDSILNDGVKSDLVIDVQTYGWQAYRASAFTDMWFVYISRMTLIDTHSKAIIDEWTCSYIDKHAWSSKPYLLGFFGNGKAPLAAELSKAGDHCLNEFLSKSLRIPLSP